MIRHKHRNSKQFPSLYGVIFILTKICNFEGLTEKQTSFRLLTELYSFLKKIFEYNGNTMEMGFRLLTELYSFLKKIFEYNGNTMEMGFRLLTELYSFL